MNYSKKIIAYKPQGQVDQKYPMLKNDTFFLVLMTEFQTMLYKDFSSLACVDSTHKTNQYGYKLVTLLVVDELPNHAPLHALPTTHTWVKACCARQKIAFLLKHTVTHTFDILLNQQLS